MKIAMLFIHDRPEYAEISLASARENVPECDYFIEVDDTTHEMGFAGAIQRGWDQVLETDADYVFHLEGDFIFTCPVPLGEMVDILKVWPMAQVALKRQAWNAEERAAGGIVQLHPADFDYVGQGSIGFTRHRRFFTTNPSVYPRAIAERGWPQAPESEGVFTHRLLADGLYFAFLGRPLEPPRVMHIGTERAGHGY